MTSTGVPASIASRVTGDTQILTVAQDTNGRVGLGHEVGRAVGRSVVDDDKLGGRRGLAEYRVEARAEEGAAIVGEDGDGQGWKRHGSIIDRAARSAKLQPPVGSPSGPWPPRHLEGRQY